MPSYPIGSIDGIEAPLALKLRRSGIRTCHVYLEKTRTLRGRRALAEATGIAERTLLKWTNLADLMRVPGVGGEYAELLAAAGVETVKALKHRNAARLVARMSEINAERELVRLPPSEKQVTRWIEAARSLPAMVSY